jgi:hypothetical protein
MAEQQLPTKRESSDAGSGRTIKVNMGWFRANKTVVLLAGLAVVLFSVLYGLTYWGYHSSRLPYSFDNFVHRTGLWRMYGAKTYEPVTIGEFVTMVDPRLTSVADETVIRHVVEGAVMEFEKGETSVSDIKVALAEGEDVVFRGDYHVENVFVLDRDCLEAGSENIYMPGNLEDLEPGFVVRIEFQRVFGEEWKIHNLFFIKSVWGIDSTPSVKDIYF